MKKVNKPKDTQTKDLIIILVIGLLCYFGYNEIRFSRIQKSITSTKETLEQIADIGDITAKILKEVMDKLIGQNKVVQEIENNINKKVDDKIQQKTYDTLALEQKLRQTVVVVYNRTIGATGSGVTIKYKDKYYILTAGHMLENQDDVLSFGENDMMIDDLEVVKWNYTWAEDTDDTNVSKVQDLLLLKPKNKEIVPKYYVDLDDIEPINGSPIYIVGNPVGIEDVLCEGRTIMYQNNFMYYINHTYYGNSGGGVFTKEGKLIGIVSHMSPISYNSEIPPYMIYGAVRLNIIKDFLKDVE